MNFFNLKSQFKSSYYLLVIVFILFVCCLLYIKVPELKFQKLWDDQWVVQNWYTESGFKFENIKNILIEFYHGQYSPVNQLYYTSLYALFGYNPMAFHVAGLIIHLANVVLVYFFIVGLLKYTNWSFASNEKNIALITCGLFAIHPIMVESVAWLSASKVLLAAMFFLTGLICYLRFLRTTSIFYWFMTIFFFILSFLSKEQSVTFALTICLIGFINHNGPIRPREIYEKIPFLLLALVFGYITMLSQADSGEGVLSTAASYPLFQRFLFGTYAFVEYAVKCIMPVKLLYLYLFPISVGESIPIRFWFYPLIIIIAILCLNHALKIRWLLFGILFFLFNISTALHIIPISRMAIVADRYVYLSCIGVMFVLAFGFQFLLDRYHYRSKYLYLAAFLYVGYIGTYTYLRVPAWYSSDTLKKEILDLVKINAEKSSK